MNNYYELFLNKLLAYYFYLKTMTSCNKSILHGNGNIVIIYYLVEVAESSIDSHGISKLLRNTSVILNSDMQLPTGSSIYIGEVITPGIFMHD